MTGKLIEGQHLRAMDIGKALGMTRMWGTTLAKNQMGAEEKYVVGRGLNKTIVVSLEAFEAYVRRSRPEGEVPAILERAKAAAARVQIREFDLDELARNAAKSYREGMSVEDIQNDEILGAKTITSLLREQGVEVDANDRNANIRERIAESLSEEEREAIRFKYEKDEKGLALIADEIGWGRAEHHKVKQVLLGMGITLRGRHESQKRRWERIRRERAAQGSSTLTPKREPSPVPTVKRKPKLQPTPEILVTPNPEPYETWQEWSNANPFRAWRLEKAINKSTAATYLGTSPVLIGNWEHGQVRQPGAKYMAALAEMMRIPQPELEERWNEWNSRRPRPNSDNPYAPQQDRGLANSTTSDSSTSDSSTESGIQAQHNKTLAAQQLAAMRRHTLKNCKRCNKEFIAFGRGEYCGRTCREMAYQERKDTKPA